MEQRRAVLAVLDDQRARAESHDGARSLHEIVVAGQHARFSVVDEQNIETLENFEQRGAMVLDPVIHGVAGDELDAWHGFAHAALQNGIDVGEEEEFGVAIGVGDFGLEGGEDVELSVMGFGFVEIFEIGAFPEEAFAGGVLDAARVDVAGGEDGFLLGAEVFADDGDDADIGEEAGGEREIGGCAAEAALAAAGGGFNGIVCDAANYGDGHFLFSSFVSKVSKSISGASGVNGVSRVGGVSKWPPDDSVPPAPPKMLRITSHDICRRAV